MIAHPSDRNEAATSGRGELPYVDSAGAGLTNAQYSIRSWFVFSSGCAIGCALLGLRAHTHLTTCGGMLLLFWFGVALAFAGEVLNQRGDTWLLPAVGASIIGSLVALISLFTAVFYGGLFLSGRLPW